MNPLDIANCRHLNWWNVNDHSQNSCTWVGKGFIFGHPASVPPSCLETPHLQGSQQVRKRNGAVPTLARGGAVAVVVAPSRGSKEGSSQRSTKLLPLASAQGPLLGLCHLVTAARRELLCALTLDVVPHSVLWRLRSCTLPDSVKYAKSW